jgi:ankyrin repeat protein
MEGGVRIDLRTNIFNLIRREDATLADLQKLYGIAPEKFKYKEPDTGKLPIQVAKEEERDDWVAFMESKGLKDSNAPVEFVKAVTVKKEKLSDAKQIEAKINDLIKSKNYDAFADFLEKNDINQLKQNRIATFIYNIVNYNQLKMFELMLEKKYVDLNICVYATTIVYLDFFKILLKYNMDVNKFYDNILSYNVFHIILQNNLNLITQFDLCIENKADINLQDMGEEKLTPLIITIINNSPNRSYFIDKLLELNVDVNKKVALNRDVMHYLLKDSHTFPDNIDIIKKVAEKNYNFNTIYIENEFNNSKSTPILKLLLNYNKIIKEKCIELFDIFLEKTDNETLNYKNSVIQNTLLHYIVRTNFDYALEKLIDRGLDINSRNTSLNTPLMLAAYYASVECVKILLDKGANKKLKNHENLDALGFALYAKQATIDNSLKLKYDTIIEYLKEKPKEEEEDKSLWKGTTKSDIDKFDTFFESPNDWSVCPICLSYVARQDGCMYMSHDCKDDNKYYHKELYNKYVYDYYGKIKVEWCTICGRSTKNHKHYELISSKAKLPDFEKEDPEIQAQLALGQNRVFFDDKNCKGFGGGGLEEKVARIRRLREYALELNDDIDKKTHAKAIKELIEEVWNAPLARSKKYAKILEKKEWNIPLSNFPNAKKNETVKNDENNSKNYENISFNEKLPEKRAPGVCPCIIGGEDNIETYSFDHKDREGGIDHAKECICAEDLTEAIKSINKAFKNVERPFGYCWFYKCKAKLYPQEIKNIVPDDVYEEYRKKFNKIMAQKGGRKQKLKYRTRKMNKKGGDIQKHVLHKIDLDKVTCYQPPLKLKQLKRKG